MYVAPGMRTYPEGHVTVLVATVTGGLAVAVRVGTA
jgi:hypothetical protein